MRLASGSLRSLSSIRRSDRRSRRTASGWKKASVSSALAKKRIRLTGSRLNTSASATLRRPLSMRKSLVRADAAARAPAQRIEQAAEPGDVLTCSHLQRRAQDGGEVADVLGDQEVVLHEALDGAQPAAVDVAQPLGHGAAARRRSAAPRRRPVRKCRWQRTVHRKSSQRRKVAYSSAVKIAGFDRRRR